MHSFRSFTDQLEQSGNLIRITREVDPRFELPALVSQLEKQRQKAYIFENVKGAEFPYVGGFYTDACRIADALGKRDTAKMRHRDLQAVFTRAMMNPVAHTVKTDASCKDIIKTGADASLAHLPVPTFFEFDSGPFITGAVGVSRHPDTGQLNVGFYRTLILDDNTMIINASSMSDLRKIYAAYEARGEEMSIAMCIGVPPALTFSASGKHPPGVSELDVAGALQGSPIEMVQAETSDLLVPADSEIVIEAKVDFSRKQENVLGEFADQYGPETAPVAKLAAITHRKDAMYYSIMAGRHPEHNTIGNISVYGILAVLEKNLREQFDNIKEINVACEPKLGTMLHIFISIEKKSDDEPEKLIRAAFAADGGLFPVSTITKRIVVVDEDIDPFNLEDVEWAIWSRLGDARKIITLPNVFSWELERCTKEGQVSARVGIDATKDLDDIEELVRPIIPGAENYDLDDYV
ncbi:MAG: UbiD family decarboxylase [Gammaproteobacteria bacterium]|nr:UbiD family decarboxylase [Gammaproteobacteria bacterium]